MREARLEPSCSFLDLSFQLGRIDHFKLRFRKNFQALLEEQVRDELAGEDPKGKG